MAAVAVHVESISKRFSHPVKGAVYAARNVSLSVQPGEFLTLLGPSGCGKTTTLRIIAGFEKPDTGRILFGDQEVTRLPANRRNIGFVFQNYALFPHLTVFENIAYGLQVRGYSAEEIQREVRTVLELVGLPGFERQFPAQMSGGEQQRVAVARAIVIKPQVLLFDEPLSNLDAKLRVQMRVEIKRLQKSLATTSVYVTHDQLEAMTLADRLVVLSGGQIEQIGDPISVYERPASTFVASFIGSPAMNLITTASANGRLSLPGGAGLDAPDMGKGAEVILGVRPEHLALASEQPAEAGGLTLDVVAGVLEPVGAESFLYGTVGSESGPQVVIRVPAHARYELGQRVSFTASAAKLHAFDKATGKRIED